MMKLPAEECEDLIGSRAGETYGSFEVISNEITSHSRWSVGHTVIVKYTDGKVYRVYYSMPATESQDEDPWGYSKEVEFQEMRPVEKTITVYEPIAA